MTTHRTLSWYLHSIEIKTTAREITIISLTFLNHESLLIRCRVLHYLIALPKPWELVRLECLSYVNFSLLMIILVDGILATPVIHYDVAPVISNGASWFKNTSANPAILLRYLQSESSESPKDQHHLSRSPHSLLPLSFGSSS